MEPVRTTGSFYWSFLHSSVGRVTLGSVYIVGAFVFMYFDVEGSVLMCRGVAKRGEVQMRCESSAAILAATMPLGDTLDNASKMLALPQFYLPF